MLLPSPFQQFIFTIDDLLLDNGQEDDFSSWIADQEGGYEFDPGHGAAVIAGSDVGEPITSSSIPEFELTAATPYQPDSLDARGGSSGGGGGVGGGNGGGGGGNGGGGGGGNTYLDFYHAGAWDGDLGYDITIEFTGSGWTTDLQQAFINAADYFTGTFDMAGIISDDIGGDSRYRGVMIDDLYVTAELTSIDGVGGVLGQAGPEAIWSGIQLTAAGFMQFDSADAQSFYSIGLWDDIIMHEMMHVLGFGTLWEYGNHDLVNDSYGYVGQAGLDAYRDYMNDQSLNFIPVEDGGGAGTAGGHWDEAALNNELMTGYINNDGDPATNDDNYLSEFSVMSLADLGYAVDYHDYPYDDALVA